MTENKPIKKLRGSAISGLAQGLSEKLKIALKQSNSLLNIRETLGLDKKNPKELIIQVKNAFKTKDSLNLEEFSSLILQIESTSEP